MAMPSRPFVEATAAPRLAPLSEPPQCCLAPLPHILFTRRHHSAHLVRLSWQRGGGTLRGRGRRRSWTTKHHIPSHAGGPTTTYQTGLACTYRCWLAWAYLHLQARQKSVEATNHTISVGMHSPDKDHWLRGLIKMPKVIKRR